MRATSLSRGEQLAYTANGLAIMCDDPTFVAMLCVGSFGLGMAAVGGMLCHEAIVRSPSPTAVRRKRDSACSVSQMRRDRARRRLTERRARNPMADECAAAGPPNTAMVYEAADGAPPPPASPLAGVLDSAGWSAPQR